MTYLKNIIVLLILGFCCNFIFCQSITGNIESYLNNIVSAIPGSGGNNYFSPTTSQIVSWGNTVTEISNGNIVNARIIADSLNYQIVAYTDNTSSPNQLFYVLEEKNAQINYWGTYVFNSAPCRENLILQAPHPKFDFNTGLEAIFCFKRLSAKALFLTGTHRCNHTTSSACSGSTSVCSGSSQPFKISDMAHNTLSVFQKTTEVLTIENNNAVFVQLHGFSKTSSDPYVIMSNGTRATPLVDYVTLIKNELAVVDNSLTFKLAHIDLSWTKLIAFTNTQGRLVNGSTSPCNTSISSTTGKFVHIEQEKTKLRDDSVGWNKMFVALSNVFNCTTVSIKEGIWNKLDYKIYPNPTQNDLTIETEGIKHIKLIDIKGRTLFFQNFSEVSKATLNLNDYSKGLIFIIVQTRNTIITEKIINH